MTNDTDVTVHRRTGGEQARRFLTVGELAVSLRIGRSKAYELCHQPGFPAIRIGRRTIRVAEEALSDWLAGQAGFHSLGQDTTRDEMTRGQSYRGQGM